jgi:mitochondrial import inner membrane translocase subunit TIM17
MGCIGGSIFHVIAGAKKSPKGERIMGGFSQMKLRAPIVGGNFAVWGGLFSTFDCILLKFRKKEDPYNSITAGFLTGFTLAIRGGLAVASRNGIFGGIFIGILEGFGILINKFMVTHQESMMKPPSPPSDINVKSKFTKDIYKKEFVFEPNY